MNYAGRSQLKLLSGGERILDLAPNLARDKVEFMKEARERGYRVYLYFVATDDPEINLDRVRRRVRGGGRADGGAGVLPHERRAHGRVGLRVLLGRDRLRAHAHRDCAAPRALRRAAPILPVVLLLLRRGRGGRRQKELEKQQEMELEAEAEASQ